jgi:hypothetical protein
LTPAYKKQLIGYTKKLTNKPISALIKPKKHNMKISLKLFMSCILVLCLIGLQSCQKEEITDTKPQNSGLNIETKADYQAQFAKILASALGESLPLRELLKKEALKQFDKDYDVLYQAIRNKSLGSETVYELLSKNDSKNELAAIEENLPLLTIYVPVLPDFSAEKWNTQVEIPQVAIAESEDENTPVVDSNGKITSIPPDHVPAFPTVVVKENERVVVNPPSPIQGRNAALLAHIGDKFSYSFADKAFDGIHPSVEAGRTATSSEIDPAVINAYNLKMDWHRDHIYYGLTPTTTKGNFKNNYSEFISSFTIENVVSLDNFSDQTGDPQYKKVRKKNQPMWTEGSFEFKITVIINSKNGVGTELNKVFSVKGSDLFTLEYKKALLLYFLKSITPKSYNPNLELVPWDLQNYGTAWKFLVYEYDPAQQTEHFHENTTKFAANFDVETKIGLKFGGSAAIEDKRSFMLKTTLDSDYLGDAILGFDYPVITGVSNSVYSFREIKTGTVKMIVEPKRLF